MLGQQMRASSNGLGGTISIALQAATAGMVLLLLLSGRGPLLAVEPHRASIAALANAPSGAARAAAGPCGWTPYLLPPEAHQWALGAARQGVPSLVHPVRQYLTGQLAAGVLLQGIEGDFVETGVFTGGTSIIMLQALDKWDPAVIRRHWAADSFKGLPPPVEQDAKGTLREGVAGAFATGRDVFEGNVRKFAIPSANARLHILEGWFNDTLPEAPITRIAFLRLDGDLYVSTKDALDALYDKVAPGGIVYIDDYGSFSGCRRAVDEFRAARGITEPLYLQALPDQLFDAPPAGAAWEAAWWVKCPSS